MRNSYCYQTGSRLVPCLNVVHGKTIGRKADLDNEQISATRAPKMKPESSKWLRRTSKKRPMSQQWRHLGNRRHLRKHKRPQLGPMERPNGAPDAAWRRKGSEQGSNMGAKRCQKRVEIRNPGEVENRAPSAAGAQVSPRKGTPSGPIKLVRSLFHALEA